jgi:uncharacterized membrane protein
MRLAENFVWCIAICTIFNLLLVISVVLAPNGPELLMSVINGWTGPDFLFVLFAPSLVGSVLLTIGDAVINYHIHKR